MVERNRKSIKEILYTEHLDCYPAENQAAKIFAKWLSEHPEYSIDNVDMEINTIEREEDYYGNGGGYDRSVSIFKYREETDDELDDRIYETEKNEIGDFMQNFKNALTLLTQNMNIFPYMVGSGITDTVDDITHMVKCKIEDKFTELKSTIK